MSILAKKLNGKRPLGVYFQSWSSNWSNTASNLDLTNINNKINIVFLSFINPNCSYIKGSNTFSGTGLDFSSNFSTVKESIQILKTRGVIVMLSVGGATYHFNDSFNPKPIIDFANDLGVDGIDIDWEPTTGASEANQLGSIINKIRINYQSGLLSMAAFSVGAYGQGDFTNSQPSGQYTSMCIPGLKSNGHQLDFINIMSYDAGNTYNPIEAFKSYRSYYKGPLLIGAEVPPEAWGGNVITLDKVNTYSKYILTDNPLNGLFVWSYQKQGQPSSIDIISSALNVFNLSKIPTIPQQNPSSNNSKISIPSKPTPPSSLPQPTVPQPTAPPTVSQPTASKPTVSQPTVSQPTVPQPTVSSNNSKISLWNTNIKYSINDIVLYNDKKYKCIQSHTSIVTWEPSIYTQALWSLL